MTRFNCETHELIMVWLGIFVFGLTVSAIVLLTIEATR